MGSGGFDIAAFGIWYIVFLFSTVAHEASHGLVAYLGGDLKAYSGGLVTLDPLVHVKRSPVGMVVVPLITFYQMGWMMGWASVPFDPVWGRRHPLRQGLMSLAGPATNLLLCGIGLILIEVLVGADVFRMAPRFDFSNLVVPASGAGPGSLAGGLAMGLSVLVNLNLLLGLFNLVPFPPMDGAGVLEGFFPRLFSKPYDFLRSIPILELVGLLVAWNLFPYVYHPAVRALYRLLG